MKQPVWSIVNASVRFIDFARVRPDKLRPEHVESAKQSTLGVPILPTSTFRLVPGVNAVDPAELELFGIEPPANPGDPVRSLGQNLADLRWEILSDQLHPLIARQMLATTVHRPTLRAWRAAETRETIIAAIDERLAAKTSKRNADYIAAREVVGC